MARTTTHEKPQVKAAPVLGQRGKIVQEFGTVFKLPTGLEEETTLESTRNLNQVLADTITIAQMYKSIIGR